MLEAGIIRESLLNVGQRPALERIASLPCEHIFRLKAVGIDSDFIPLTQIDLVMSLVFPWSIQSQNPRPSEGRRSLEEQPWIRVVHRGRLVQLPNSMGATSISGKCCRIKRIRLGLARDNLVWNRRWPPPCAPIAPRASGTRCWSNCLYATPIPEPHGARPCRRPPERQFLRNALRRAQRSQPL